MRFIRSSFEFFAVICACMIAMAQQAGAVTPFDETIPGPAGLIYHQLSTFQTPGGVVTSELTVARMVVTLPTSDPGLFRIQPTPGSGRTTEDVTVGGGPSNITEDSGAVTVATVIAQVPIPEPTVAAGFQMVEILVSYQPGYDFAGGPETWSLQALQLAASHRYAGYIGDPCVPVTATNCVEEVTQSRLTVSPSTLEFGDVQINLPTDITPIDPYTIENTGTAELTMSGPFEPASGPFSLSGSFPSSLQPMETTEVNIQFRPEILGGGGANDADIDIASNDPASPTTMSFSGTGVTLNAAFVLDLSGSMTWAPDGTKGVPESDSRLGDAKEGGFQLFEIYRELTGGQANFGLYGFPDPASPTRNTIASSTNIVAMTTGNAALGPVGVALEDAPPEGGGVVAGGNTPMAEGIGAAQADLDTGANQRPLILLLSDGAHNLDSPPTNEQPEDWIPELQADGIRMFTIGYGDETASNVDFELLDDLAVETEGAALPANATDFATLRKSFREALKEWLGLREPVDPNSTIDPNQTKTHDVCIDRSDYTATFVVDWDHDQADAISFTLTSPTGEVITPSTPGVTYRSSDTYAFYVIKGERIRGGAGAGNWRMRLEGADDLPNGTDYSYSVLTGTPYVPRPTFRYDHLLTGDVLAFEIDLSHLPETRYGGLQLRAQYDSPAQSFRTFVAEANVEWEAVSQELIGQTAIAVRTDGTAVRATDPQQSRVEAEPAASIFEAKTRVIQDTDQRFSNERLVGELQLYDDGSHGDRIAGDGVFANNSLTLGSDGLYQFHVFIDDLKAAPAECLGGDFAFGQYVGVGLTAEVLADDLAFEDIRADQFFDPSAARFLGEQIPEGLVRRALIATPRDRFGNLWGTGRADQVAFAYEGARIRSPIIDNGDGSYIQLVDFEEGSRPMAWVTIDGVATQAVSITELAVATPVDGPKIPPWVWALILLVLVLVVIVVALYWRGRRTA